MFNTLKLWAGGAIMALVGVFVAVFKYRSNKIERLESTNETLRKNNGKLKDDIKSKQKEIKTRETVNQIMANDDAAINASELRIRAAKRDSDKNG